MFIIKEAQPSFHQYHCIPRKSILHGNRLIEVSLSRINSKAYFEAFLHKFTTMEFPMATTGDR